jgi:hypothetical protein
VSVTAKRWLRAALVVLGVAACYPSLRGSGATDAWSQPFYVRGPGATLGHILHAATLPNGLVELMGTSELTDGSEVNSLVGTIQAPAFGQLVPSSLFVVPQNVPYEVPFGTPLPDGTVIGDLLLCGGGPFDADGSLYHAGGSRFIVPPYQPDQPVLYVLGLAYPFRYLSDSNTWSRLSGSPFVGVGASIAGPSGVTPGFNTRWYSTAIHRGDNRMLVIAGSELIRYNYLTGQTDFLPNLSIEMDDHGTKTLISSNDRTPQDIFNPHGYTHAWQQPAADAKTLMIGAAGNPVFMTDDGNFTVSASRRRGAGARSDDGAAAIQLPIRLNAGEWGYNNGAVASIGGEAATDPEHQLDVYDPVADTWTPYEMGIRRGYPTALTLPDLRTLIIGGAGSDYNTNVGFAQYWNPRNGELTTSAAAMAEVCGYHTTATLLLDGSVFTTCGQPSRIPRLGGERGTGRIFYPDYMSKARPAILGAPATATYGAVHGVYWSGTSPIGEIDILSLPSMTHSFVDQRAVQLKIASTLQVSDSAYFTTIEFPTEKNVAPAGYYMLVVIDAAHVPSAATIVQLK